MICFFVAVKMSVLHIAAHYLTPEIYSNVKLMPLFDNCVECGTKGTPNAYVLTCFVKLYFL